MIRDPSDGSVRHHPKPLVEKTISDDKPVLGTTTSGLRTGSKDPKYLARREESENWLRDYRAGKFKQTDGEQN